MTSSSENESDYKIINAKQTRHHKKKVPQDDSRGVARPTTNGRRSPQDRNDKNSRPESSEIFTSIFLSPLSNSQREDQCNEHDVITLKGLQSQVQTAMKQLATLQTHANLVQKSLEAISVQVNYSATSITSSSMNNNGLSTNDNGSGQGGVLGGGTSLQTRWWSIMKIEIQLRIHPR